MARQSTFKRVRHAVNKQKSRVIIEYMRENWDVVLNSSVSMMKTLDFLTRFRFALDIMLGSRKRAMRAIRGEEQKTKFNNSDHSEKAPPPGTPKNKKGLQAPA